MSSNGNFISKYDPFKSISRTPINRGFTSFRPGTNFGVPTTGTLGDKSILLRILGYLFAAFIAIMIILLFVHYFITPVFQTTPGGSGVIPVPGFDDGKLYWNRGTITEIKDKDTPIHGMTYGYSMIMDMFIENPMNFSNTPRVLFSRGAVPKANLMSETISGLFQTYNLVNALAPDTTDLIVSILNKDNNMENCVLSNVPVQTPFRLGIVVMEQAMEVYINGHLIKTRAFASPPMAATGHILPPQGTNADIAKIRNLKMWNRLLSPPEIRYAKPTMLAAKDFGATPIPSSGGCGITPPSLEQAGTDTLNTLPTNVSTAVSKYLPSM